MACARFSPLPGILITRGNSPPVFPGTTRRYLAFFGGVNAFSPRIRGISARIPRNSSRSAAAAFTVRDRAFSGPPAAFCPAFSRPPPAASRGPPAWPYDLAGHPSGARPGRGGEGLGAERHIQERATTEKINTGDNLLAAPTTIVLRAVRVYIVWEFTRRFIPGTACAFAGSGGYRCRQVYVKEYVIAGAKERPPVRLSRAGVSGGGRGDAPAARCGLLPGRGAGRPGEPRRRRRRIRIQRAVRGIVRAARGRRRARESSLPVGTCVPFRAQCCRNSEMPAAAAVRTNHAAAMCETGPVLDVVTLAWLRAAGRAIRGRRVPRRDHPVRCPSPGHGPAAGRCCCCPGPGAAASSAAAACLV